ncbi:MAG: hypothetical protein Q8P56_05040 [Candidatus Uhrbacteria bacterium]|nr:hypothetical protein [Candidatus Uhrbacteria bacterium]
MINVTDKDFLRERERLISWVLAHPAGLVRTKYFERVADEITINMLAATHNSVTTVVLLHWILDGNLRKLGVLDLFDLVHEHLCSSTFVSTVQNVGAKDIVNAMASGRNDRLYGAFFEYYWARLGKVLRMTRFISHRPSVFCEHEREAIERLSWLLFCTQYPGIEQAYVWRKEKRRLDFLSRWKVLHRLFARSLYDQSWLDSAVVGGSLLEDYPESIRHIGRLLLREYFPVFWNSFEDNFLKNMFYASNLGWLAGGQDTDELIQAARPNASR